MWEEDQLPTLPPPSCYTPPRQVSPPLYQSEWGAIAEEYRPRDPPLTGRRGGAERHTLGGSLPPLENPLPCKKKSFVKLCNSRLEKFPQKWGDGSWNVCPFDSCNGHGRTDVTKSICTGTHGHTDAHIRLHVQKQPQEHLGFREWRRRVSYTPAPLPTFQLGGIFACS